MTEFKDAQFMTAKEKQLVFNNWKSFLNRIQINKGETDKAFTERLYHHLMQHCSFIAHYDRYGFFCTYFEDPEDTFNFFQQFDKDKDYVSYEYNMSWIEGEYSDLNQAMCEEFEKIKEEIYAKLKAQLKENKLEELKQLQTEVENL